ncbi:MAG: aminotransferase class I/II-fold pyridoxal phosphate-dependent enzyme [Balneolales bacterium]
MIPYGRQHITEEDIEAVVEVLKSDFLTQGPVLPKFEQAFADYVGSDFAVAVANGTAALHLSILALGVDEGDQVIVPPMTFAASANCVRYCGGEVVFADIHPETWLLDVDKVKERLESSDGTRIKGIIPVDFTGRPVHLEALRELADEAGLWILEDACHAPGGYFVDSRGEKQFCGNGQYADLSIFSFHPVKHIASGEGGMITTNNRELYHKLQKLRTHGIMREADEFENSVEFARGRGKNTPRSFRKQKVLPSQEGRTDMPSPGNGERADGKGEQAESSPRQPRGALNPPPGEGNYPGWYMEMQELGYNYRLTDFQAALGLSQLSRADEGLARRREIAGGYEKAFRDQPFVRRQAGVIDGHAYHLYVLEVENRLGLYNYLREKQIYSQIHYIPLHLMPYYRNFGWKEGDMPAAEAYYSGCISLPMYPTLTDEQQEYVIEAVFEFYDKN